MSIYDFIRESIIDIFLKNNVKEEEILPENGIPDDSLDFFIRPVWVYGNMSDEANKIKQANDLFVIEMYERERSSSNRLSQLIRSIRFDLTNVKRFSNDFLVANLSGVSVSTNFNDPEWRSYIITIETKIIKETL